MPKGKSGNSLLTFFVGLLLLGAGLYMIASQINVSASFGWVRVGGLSIPFGLTTIPLIIGIIWMFVKPKAVIPKIVTVLGVLFILVGIIGSVRLHFAYMTLYEYILMFGMTAAGIGLMLRTLFASRDKEKKDNEKE